MCRQGIAFHAAQESSGAHGRKGRLGERAAGHTGQPVASAPGFKQSVAFTFGMMVSLETQPLKKKTSGIDKTSLDRLEMS